MGDYSDLREPLLKGSSLGQEPGRQVSVQSTGVNQQFLTGFIRLIRLLQPWAAFLLVGLSLVETVIGAQAGKVNGGFYRVLVDKDLAGFKTVLFTGTLAFTGVTLVKSTKSFLTELFSLRWRLRLTALLQDEYCAGDRFYSVERTVDNPDQRVIQDGAEFCSVFGTSAVVFIAAPFKVAFYTWWMVSIMSWGPVGVVYAFFLVALPLQRLLLSPIARRVYRQELVEGNLRYAHMRIRMFLEEVALWRGNAAEHKEVKQRLDDVGANGMCLVVWHWALTGATVALEYCGALLNYLCVAIPVLGGAGAKWDSGQRAQFISNASFATLSLIYSFTEVIDLSEKVAQLAGLTARLTHLIDALSMGGQPQDGGSRGPDTISVASHNLPSSPETPDARGNAALLEGPRSLISSESREEIEISIHQLGFHLKQRVVATFPDAPQGCSQILAVLTFQSAQCDLAPHPGLPVQQQVSAEMERLLSNFLAWEAVVYACLTALGYWVDAVDPCSATALHGPRGQRWSEVHGAGALLGYATREGSACPLVEHPVHGTAAYPVTLFTNAPLAALKEALRCSSAMDRAASPPALPVPARPTVLELEAVSVMTPGGVTTVHSLHLRLTAGESCILEGPSGCGKSTLVGALRGLHPTLLRGGVRLPLPSQVVFVPQTPLAAPSGSLAEQVTYPGVGQGGGPHMFRLLCAVQLEYLLQRVTPNWDAPQTWASMLSPGELQRLGFARILHQHPVLAVLDEASSGLSSDQASRLLALLRRAGIAVLMTAQPGSPLRDAVDKTLLLAGDGSGTWKVLDPGPS